MQSAMVSQGPNPYRVGLLGGLLKQAEWRFHLLARGIYRVAIPGDIDRQVVDGVSRLDALQTLELAAHPGLDLSRDWAERAIARGDHCLASRDGDRVVGYLWVSRERLLRDEGVVVRLPPDSEYRYKVFVRPECRGRGIAPRMYRSADRLAASEGVAQAFLCIGPDNTASIASAVKSGARRIGFVLVWSRTVGAKAWPTTGATRSGLRFETPGSRT